LKKIQFFRSPEYQQGITSCQILFYNCFLFHQIHTLTNQKAFLFLTECTKLQTWRRASKSTCSYASWSNCDFSPPNLLEKKKIEESGFFLGILLLVSWPRLSYCKTFTGITAV